MARVFALVLMLIGIYLGVVIYTGGAEPAAPAEGEVVREEAAPSGSSGGPASPTAVTSRVRERVTGYVEDGARRHTGE